MIQIRIFGIIDAKWWRDASTVHLPLDLAPFPLGRTAGLPPGLKQRVKKMSIICKLFSISAQDPSFLKAGRSTVEHLPCVLLPCAAVTPAVAP